MDIFTFLMARRQFSIHAHFFAQRQRRRIFFFLAVLFSAACLILPARAAADGPTRRFPLNLQPQDVIATGNEWIALPTIRASDGALGSFNVLSMRDRGLLEVTGDSGAPVLQPYFLIDGKPLPFATALRLDRVELFCA
jgi:hypothetical protein